MKPTILAVAMLDWQTFGTDRFYVQVSPSAARLYEVNVRTRQARPLSDEPDPLAMVTAAIEKFGAMYRVTEPVEVESEAALCDYVGKFELTDDGRVRLSG